MRTAILVLALVIAGVGTASAEAIVEGKVTDLLGKPVPNVRVHILVGVDQQIVLTDKDGHYQAVIDGNQKVSIVVGAGDLHTFRRGTIKDGARQRLDFELEIADGEIIRIIDDKPPTIPPKLKIDGPRQTPPYSDQAVERDAWAKAWLLLDISETGKVLRVKLVKRPGFDLDEIAVKEAMKLQFAPALDEHGKPMRTSVFWAMEWPSYGWLVEHAGSAQRLPEESYEIDLYSSNFAQGAIITNTQKSISEGGRSGGRAVFSDAPPTFITDMGQTLHGVRCAGTGPLNLDARHPVYRDCSAPNPKKLPYLPWLDGTQPIPPDPPEIAPKPEPPLHLTRASYIPQITASAATALLIGGWVYAYVEKTKYEDRVIAVSGATSPKLTTAAEAEQYGRDVDGYHRWQKLSTFAAVAVIGATGVTAMLWFRHQRRADFSVQPENSGASLSLSGRF
jgi:TonB-like protein